MNERTPLVIVWGMESGPAGAGRPIEVNGEEIGIAATPEDVPRLLDWAGIGSEVEVRWHGDADCWT